MGLRVECGVESGLNVGLRVECAGLNLRVECGDLRESDH